MNEKRLYVAAIIFLLAFSAACQKGQPPVETIIESSVKAVAPVNEEIEGFLNSYFATWSEGDMAGYKSHFHEKAVIYMIGNGQVAWSKTLENFIDMQSQHIADADPLMSEHMTSYEVLEDSVAASVTVDWALEQGPDSQTGIDRFTLMKDVHGDWKIISLVFYSF